MIRKLSIIGFVFGVYRVLKYFGDQKTALNTLKAEIARIRNVNISLNGITLTIDLRLINESNLNLGIDTFEFIKLTQIDFYNKTNNNYIGTALTDVSDITVEANSFTDINDIEAEIPLDSILSNLSLFTGKQNKMYVVLHFEALGKNYELVTT